MQPAWLFTFDEGYANVYNDVFPIMQTAGMTGTVYVNGNAVDTAGYITSAQIAEMAAAGWSMASHTKSHIPLNSLTAAQILAELQASITDLTSKGCNSVYHLSYPGGAIGDSAAAMVATGMLTGRTIGSTPFHYRNLIPYDMLSWGLVNTTTLADAQTKVDTAIATSQIQIVHFHNVATPADDNLKWPVADFQSLVTYIASQSIEVLTIDELWAKYQAYPLKD